MQVCRSVLALEPAHPRANFKCGSALRQLRREPDALVHYRRHLVHNPDDEQARFWIAVLSGDDVARMPASHVAALFDFYAPKFEEHLVQSLQYCTPEALVGVLAEAARLPDARRDGGGRQRWGSAIDIGCGTGLMGPLLREHVSSLDGVDLSAKMVDKARDKGCYDRLFVEDAVNFLSEQKGRGSGYDLLVAADVLVYIGDLEPLLRAAAGVSRDGTLFACSTECTSDVPDGGDGAVATPGADTLRNGSATDSTGAVSQPCAGRTGGSGDAEADTHSAGPGQAAPGDSGPDDGTTGAAAGGDSAGALGYRCSITGRFRHDTEYVKQVATAQGWRLLKHEQARIRCNAGKPVMGDLFVFVA